MVRRTSSEETASEKILRLLLDTQAFLWFILNDPRISGKAHRAIENVSHEVFISVVTPWEIIQKFSVGRLLLSESPEVFIHRHISIAGLSVLPITLSHTLALAALPLHHRDPFDRMLIAQAISDNLTLISSDKKMRAYDVKIFW
ncbi:MAG: type II toxin-antitoxin system VapC family toxin [Actinomycetota bacterium]